MLKSGKRIKRRRRYSEEFKLKIVHEYESGKYGVYEMEKLYGISNGAIYNWIYKYSKYNKKSIKVVEMKDSQSNRIKEMETRIKELERVVGQKQINIDYLEKIIDLAKEEYDIDIKKNSSTLRCGGSGITKKK